MERSFLLNKPENFWMRGKSARSNPRPTSSCQKSFRCSVWCRRAWCTHSPTAPTPRRTAQPPKSRLQSLSWFTLNSPRGAVSTENCISRRGACPSSKGADGSAHKRQETDQHHDGAHDAACLSRLRLPVPHPKDDTENHANRQEGRHAPCLLQLFHHGNIG